VLGESIASAFDVYLVGRLLGHSPDSSFLASQVPRMSEVAQSAGLDDEDFEDLLQELASAPERAFEDLRQLLFDATVALVEARDLDEAATVLTSFRAHRFAPLLHHYELSTWVLRSRLERAGTHAEPAAGGEAHGVDAALRASNDALAWLEKRWVRSALE
jgi:hypothetical protein